MSYLTIIGIAVGLSMDAFAVSVTNGCIIKELKKRHAIMIALSFGVFQGVMPLLGWSTALLFTKYISAYSHYIAFGLLIYIGVKMIRESFKKNDKNTKTCLHFPTLMIMSIATSIDALAVGVSFACLSVNILTAVAIISVITFVICLIGVYIGNYIGHFFESRLELFGGVVLIVIGIKILVERMI